MDFERLSATLENCSQLLRLVDNDEARQQIARHAREVVDAYLQRFHASLPSQSDSSTTRSPTSTHSGTTPTR